MAAAYDVIVIGVGGMGSAACEHLARRGCRVLGLEQFALGHDRGSSHGETRIIRLAYFEHPDYVPLLQRAYRLWNELEQRTGRTLLHQNGLILSGPAAGETITGALRSARDHQLAVERLTPTDLRHRFPGFAPPEEHAIVFESRAGYLAVEDCVAAHLAAARSAGAEFRERTPVLRWGRDGRGVFVETASERFTAQGLVITAGAWAARVLADLRLPLIVRRKFVGWFATSAGSYAAAEGTPTYYCELPEGAFYGFPSLDGTSLKVAEHTGGAVVDDPASVDRAAHADDVAPLARFVQRFLPQATTTLVRHSVCLYTLTPDQHFLIATHPEHPQVQIAAGFSGHGFKFTPVVGAALADLATTGRSELPIGFLGWRAALGAAGSQGS